MNIIITADESIALIGASGMGKTIRLNVMSVLLTSEQSNILVGVRVNYYSRRHNYCAI